MSNARHLCIILLLAATTAAYAGGPLYVGGPSDAMGKPYHWANGTANYRTDLGTLGSMTKSQADTFTSGNFAVWHAVATANVTATKAGDLAEDVTGTNFMTLANNPASDINTTNAIIYDSDGAITDLLFGAGANTQVLGFAGIFDLTSNGTDNTFTLGGAVLNGTFVDGKASPTPDISQQKFSEVFIHEFGHFLGLDHSQVNVEILSNQGDPDMQAGVPTMFPFLLDTPARPSLAPDDIAAISALYPKSTFATDTGRISGQILFSDGVSPAQGYNVVAQMVDDPNTPQDESKRVAVSSVSGFLFTSSAGNPVVPDPGSSFGSRDTSVLGMYDIPGLPPGSYTVKVEAIFSGFLFGSSVGPIGQIGFQFPMIGNCFPGEFLDGAESDVDNCADQSPLTITPGSVFTDQDIILNGTPPTFDAWESAELWKLHDIEPFLASERRLA